MFELPRNKAFTLAEVLITLGIIGIVAAMTIPTLVNNYQKTQYVTAAKKFYSQFNQILLQMAVESGENDSIASYFSNGSTAYISAITSHYKILKDCGTTAGEECFTKFDDFYDGSAKATTYWTANVSPNYKFITSDGVSFAITSFSDSCTSNRGFAATPDSPVYNSTCGYVFVDVNGKNKPNCQGRDVFLFYITSKKTPMLYPKGGFYQSGNNTGTAAGGGSQWWNYNNSQLCGTSTNADGALCAGKLVENGWVMDW